jgi:hypothetical protein
LLVSCGTTPPDEPLCTQINIRKGYCVNTISSTEFEVSEAKKYKGKTWWQLKPHLIYMPASSWSAIKKFIVKACKRSNMCKGKDITSWNRTVEKIDKKIAN